MEIIIAIVQKDFKEAMNIAKVFGATRLILFGSAAASSEDARDFDLACAGVSEWKLYELGAKLEEMARIPLDRVPLSPPTRFTRLIEQQGTDFL